MSELVIPLFPLHSVLFPGGALPLKIFEQRYMEMAAACIKLDAPFGVCLIASGQEVGAPARSGGGPGAAGGVATASGMPPPGSDDAGAASASAVAPAAGAAGTAPRSGGAPAKPHAVGTLARVAKWDMPQLGVLQVVVHGSRRFRILRRFAEPSGLLCGEIELLPEPEPQALPGEAQVLLPLLRAIVADLGAAGPPPPHRFDDAVWVGYRYCEVLPMPNAARQMLLELDDAPSRLEIVRKFLEQKGLL